MRYLTQEIDLGAESGADAVQSAAATRAHLNAAEERWREVSRETDPILWATLAKEIALLYLALEQPGPAWSSARSAFDIFFANRQWEPAVESCHILCQLEHQESLAALGQGIWLAVTVPIDPELTVAMLRQLIDETPDSADGAAVAAATAAYVVDLRAQGEQRNNLSFFTLQMLGDVARRHSMVTGQREFDAWMERLELTAPQKFLVRLRNVIDVLVQDEWWFDRDALQSRLPFN